MSKDYYAVLGLPKNASGSQVRSRFLELARTRHPDRFAGQDKDQMEREFQEITEAASLLGDPVRRREYDAQLGGSEDAQPESARLAKAYLQMGVKSYKSGNFEQAAENFHRATKEDPANARAWYFLAKACSRERRFAAKAAAAADKACRLEPMNASYLELAGDTALEGGDSASAEDYYRKSLSWGGDESRIQARLDAIRKPGLKGRTGLFGKAT